MAFEQIFEQWNNHLHQSRIWASEVMEDPDGLSPFGTFFEKSDKLWRKPYTLMDIYDLVSQQLAQQKVYRALKDGSEAFIIVGGDNNGVIINRIDSRAALIWEKIAQGKIRSKERIIPVAYYLHGYLTNAAKMDIYSRYSGLPVDFLLEYLKLPVHSNNTVAQELRHRIKLEVEKIESDFSQAGLHHRHAHLANYTVEFIAKPYLQAQLQAGFSINNLPYDEDAFTYNPQAYLDNPTQYEVVVRVIDLDRIMADDLSLVQTELTRQYEKMLVTALDNSKEVVATLGRLSLSYLALDPVLHRDFLLHQVGLVFDSQFLYNSDELVRLSARYFIASIKCILSQFSEADALELEKISLKIEQLKIKRRRHAEVLV